MEINESIFFDRIKKIAKKSAKKFDAVIFLIAIFIVLVLVNLLSLSYFKRFDLTANKKFSLSSVTKKKLKDLDDVVNIKAYFSKQLPPRYVSIRQEVSDFLNDYASSSQGKLKIKYLDPLADPKYEQETLSYGVPQLQFSDIERDKFQVQNGFLGLVILYEDRFETIPIIENIENLEYDLTSAILKVLNKKKKNIALLTFPEEGKTEGNLSTDEYQFLKKFLEKQYQIIPIALNSEKEIDKNINTLIVIGDKGKVSDYEKYQIDQFIMSQKGVLFLVNGVSLGEGLSGQIANHNLFNLLEFYGTKINSDLVLDSYADIASFQSGYTTFLTPYPFWPKIQESGFSLKNPITVKLETMTFQWPSSLTILRNNQKKANFETLIKSSKKSWITSQINNLSPQQKFNPTENDFRENNLAVLITGNLKSFYLGKEVPKPEEVKEVNIPETRSIIKETKNSKIVVVSNANFLKDNFLSRSQESLVFFLNTVDYLNSETELMEIRSKSLLKQPIPQLSDNNIQLIRWGNIIAPLILVGITYLLKKYLESKTDRQVMEILK